jgi:alpha-beta hydrolase superfamily lysophospholipase
MPSSLKIIVPFLAPLLALAGAAPAADAPQQRTVRVGPDTDVPVRVFPARGRELILWLPSAAEEQASNRQLAARLAREGFEVWMADLLGARFLPELISSLDEIPGSDVAALIEAAAASGKQVVLLSGGRGALPLLAGAQAWRARHPGGQGLAGAVLLYPHLYVGTPEPGYDADYLPVVGATRLRIVILQPQLSPWYWQLDRLKAELERGGSRVMVKRYAGVRDRFYYRPDTTPAENALAARFPALLREAVTELKSTTEPTR